MKAKSSPRTGYSFPAPQVTVVRPNGWQHLPLGRRLEAVLHVPCRVENDVRAAAVGLHRDGRYSRVDDLMIPQDEAFTGVIASAIDACPWDEI